MSLIENYLYFGYNVFILDLHIFVWIIRFKLKIIASAFFVEFAFITQKMAPMVLNNFLSEQLLI